MFYDALEHDRFDKMSEQIVAEALESFREAYDSDDLDRMLDALHEILYATKLIKTWDISRRRRMHSKAVAIKRRIHALFMNDMSALLNLD